MRGGRRAVSGARHAVVPAVSVVPIPANATLAEASSLLMNGLTALLALERAALGEGQWLAVSGGAGLLAYYMIALAKRRGLKVVADAKPAGVALVRSRGADEVFERSGDSPPQCDTWSRTVPTRCSTRQYSIGSVRSDVGWRRLHPGPRMGRRSCRA